MGVNLKAWRAPPTGTHAAKIAIPPFWILVLGLMRSRSFFCFWIGRQKLLFTVRIAAAIIVVHPELLQSSDRHSSSNHSAQQKQSQR